MPKITIPKSYSDGNSISQSVLVTAASTINNYINNGNIEGTQIKINGIKGGNLSSVSTFDSTYFEYVSETFTIPDDKLTDANLSNLDLETLLGSNTVDHDKFINVTGGSQSIVEDGSIDIRTITTGLGDATDYTPSDFIVLDGAATTGTENEIFVDESSTTYKLATDITTRGGPVCVLLIPDTSGSTAQAPVTHTPSGGASRGLRVSLYRGTYGAGSEVGRVVSNLAVLQDRTDALRDLTTSALTFYDNPSAGDHTYYLTNRQDLSGTNTVAWDLSNFRLVAYELI